MQTSEQSVFSEAEQAALAAIVGQIIPASQEFDVPGADDPEILADILISGAHLRVRLAVALAEVDLEARDRAAMAAEFRKAFAQEAELIQILTAQCYYRDARVMRALKLDVRPPFPVGYVQEPNDFSLLDPVIQRGEIYRKVP